MREEEARMGERRVQAWGRVVFQPCSLFPMN